MVLNQTHSVSLQSWVEGSNNSGINFPIQNLPFASFSESAQSDFRIGTAIGEFVLDLKAVAQLNIAEPVVQTALDACCEPTLNKLMALGPKHWSALRSALSGWLSEGSTAQAQLKGCLLRQSNVIYKVACQIGDYTDFYSSIYHATTVGSLFRPDNPLLPNYRWVPIGYHGRSSSIGISGQSFHRPLGQTKAPDAVEPSFGPCRRLDYEVELGFFVGQENKLGNTVSMSQAEDYIFGCCLLNDWSARDIQAWEYQPLGPFLAKSFASTLSPWVLTMEALAPYRAAFQRTAGEPEPMPHLNSQANKDRGAIDIQMSCFIQTPELEKSGSEIQLSTCNFKHNYWTIAQMLSHHSSNGCNLQPGDLLGSGTISGPETEEAGSLLELTLGGKNKITLSNGEERTFLEDGDSIVMKGQCEKEGFASIGFGEVRSTLLPVK